MIHILRTMGWRYFVKNLVTLGMFAAAMYGLFLIGWGFSI